MLTTNFIFKFKTLILRYGTINDNLYKIMFLCMYIYCFTKYPQNVTGVKYSPTASVVNLNVGNYLQV